MIKLTKSLLADIAFVRFLVRVNTHVTFQSIRSTETLLAHFTFVRFLVRVNTYVSGQLGWSNKHLLANIALVPSLPLHSFSNKRSFLFSHLMILLHNIIITRHAHEHPPQSLHVVVVVSLFFSVTTLPHHDHRFHVFRSFRMFILSSAASRH
jgi:hypothetical protein